MVCYSDDLTKNKKKTHAHGASVADDISAVHGDKKNTHRSCEPTRRTSSDPVRVQATASPTEHIYQKHMLEVCLSCRTQMNVTRDFINNMKKL